MMITKRQFSIIHLNSAIYVSQQNRCSIPVNFYT